MMFLIDIIEKNLTFARKHVRFTMKEVKCEIPGTRGSPSTDWLVLQLNFTAKTNLRYRENSTLSDHSLKYVDSRREKNGKNSCLL
jgi:hypothetical protein